MNPTLVLEDSTNELFIDLDELDSIIVTTNVSTEVKKRFEILNFALFQRSLFFLA